MSASVTFKGTRNGLVIRLEGTPDLELLKNSIFDKLKGSRNFFKDAPVLLQDEIGLPENDTAELESFCRQHGLNPCGSYAKEVSEKKGTLSASTGLFSEELHEECLLVENTVRSGQAISSNGHLVVLGDINPGATVQASGHILVMGSLKGSAHAGKGGNTKATIVAYRMNPSLLRIADQAARPPENEKNSRFPERAYLAGTRIIVEPFSKIHNILVC